MAFGTYRTFAEALVALQVRQTWELFIEAQPIPISDYFRSETELTLRDYGAVERSEAAICEMLIYPVLREALKPFRDVLGIWSHEPLYHGDQLLGVPDYVIGSQSIYSRGILDIPHAMVVEAKKKDFDAGWGQYLAGMHALQSLNGDKGRVVYGMVSDGFIWRFGKLLDQTLTLHPHPYDLSRLDELLAALNHALTLCKHQVLTPASAA